MEHKHKPDLFSSLPLHLLLHIITFLPFESSRLTPFLSTHFRFVWNQALIFVPNLPIQHISHTISRFIRNFDPQDPSKNTRKMKLQVNNNKSFVLAILGPHNTMYISFSNGCNDQEQAADTFSWRLDVNDQVSISSGSVLPRCVFNGYFVKTLCLEGVDSLTYEVVSSMVLEFSFLENLKICSCNGLTSLTIDSRTKLVHLSISNCSNLRYLDVKSSLKLKTLHYKGFLPLIKIHEHFNLTKAIFDARQGPSLSSLDIFKEFSPVLLIFKNSQSLTLCRWMFQELIKPSLSSSQTLFQFYKLQELRWIDNSMKQENITFLISFLKLCPSIQRLFITIDSNSYDSKEEVTIDEQTSAKKLKTSQIRSLKLVKFEGLKIDEEDKNQVMLALQDIIDVDDKRFMLKDTRMKMF